MTSIAKINLQTASRDELVDLIRRQNAALKEHRNALAAATSAAPIEKRTPPPPPPGHDVSTPNVSPEARGGGDVAALRQLVEEYEMRIETLQQQVRLVKDELAQTRREKATESRALHEQLKALSEKSASDEETIAQLLARVQKADDGAGDHTVARRPSFSTAAPPPTPPPPGSSMKELQAATKRVAELEAAVAELRETNSFYAAVVQRQDAEERARAAAAAGRRKVSTAAAATNSSEVVSSSSPAKVAPDATVGNVAADVAELEKELALRRAEAAALEQRCAAAESELDDVRRQFWALRCDAATHCEVVAALEEQLAARERLVVALQREVTRARAPTAAAAAAAAVAVAPPSSQTAVLGALHPHQGNLQPQFGSRRESAAQLVRNDSFQSTSTSRGGGGGGGEGSISAINRPHAASVVHLSGAGGHDATAGRGLSSSSPSFEGASSAPFATLLSLPPIQISHPTPREKKMLERIALFEARMKQIEAYEVARQRSVDEVERNRADMFFSMNKQIDSQKKAIAELRQQVALAAGGLQRQSNLAAVVDKTDSEAQTAAVDVVPTVETTAVVCATAAAASAEEEEEGEPLPGAVRALQEALDVAELRIAELESAAAAASTTAASLQQELEKARAEKADQAARFATVAEKVRDIKARERAAVEEAAALRSQLDVTTAHHSEELRVQVAAAAAQATLAAKQRETADALLDMYFAVVTDFAHLMGDEDSGLDVDLERLRSETVADLGALKEHLARHEQRSALLANAHHHHHQHHAVLVTKPNNKDEVSAQPAPASPVMMETAFISGVSDDAVAFSPLSDNDSRVPAGTELTEHAGSAPLPPPPPPPKSWFDDLDALAPPPPPAPALQPSTTSAPDFGFDFFGGAEAQQQQQQSMPALPKPPSANAIIPFDPFA